MAMPMPATSHSPRISILVATWNCSNELPIFLESLLGQEWTDWELVVVDNASTDGTAEIVASLCNNRSINPERVLLSSRPDSGIYDAWNRGIALSTGTYICFIGADDEFISPASLRLIAELTTTSADIITARNAYYSSDGRFLRNWGFEWRWKRMRQSMNIAHPGMLVHRRLFESVGYFDDSYQICGDYEWFLRLPRMLRAIHSSDVILKITQSGISHSRVPKVYAETYRAQSRHLGVAAGGVYWILNWLKYFRRRLIGLA